MDWHTVKKVLKKTWHFLWYEDSLLSWIVNIILAFVLIKFLIYPGIGLVLQTDLPVVAVVSESMDHNMVWNDAAQQYAICGSNFKDRRLLRRRRSGKPCPRSECMRQMV